MLKELKITNFAVIEKQRVRFGPGLNVISGQTGAGKSVVLNALELILGARPRAQFIRSGAEQLEIEGHFDLSDVEPAIRSALPEIAKKDELILSRTINQAGKSKVSVNGKAATVSILQDIAHKLINICGQGQHISLLDPAYHLQLVDQYSGSARELKRYQEEYQVYKQLKQHLARTESDRMQAATRSAYLAELISELKAQKIYAGMRQELEAQTKKLEGGEKLVSGLQQLLVMLEHEDGPGAQATKLHLSLTELARIDPALKKYTDEAGSIKVQLSELEKDLSRHLSQLSLDEQSLELLRDRLAEIARLERKYRTNDAGLVELLEQSEKEQETLNDLLQTENVAEKLAESEARLAKLAAALSSGREKGGQALTEAVEKDLASLNMADARLRLEIEEADFGPNGADHLEILISTNKGEMFKPLRQIASGGELSRIMLVLKKNLRERSGVNVLVFDEVDSGVSGAVARAVGQKLKSLSEHSQVICITHLAQIASFSDRHLLVDKTVEDRAISVIREIEGEEKIDEIARMLAGYQITEASRESARELLSSKI